MVNVICAIMNHKWMSVSPHDEEESGSHYVVCSRCGYEKPDRPHPASSGF